jgi:hypothetical protein
VRAARSVPTRCSALRTSRLSMTMDGAVDESIRSHASRMSAIIVDRRLRAKAADDTDCRHLSGAERCSACCRLR